MSTGQLTSCVDFFGCAFALDANCCYVRCDIEIQAGIGCAVVQFVSVRVCLHLYSAVRVPVASQNFPNLLFSPGCFALPSRIWQDGFGGRTRSCMTCALQDAPVACWRTIKELPCRSSVKRCKRNSELKLRIFSTSGEHATCFTKLSQWV